MTVTLTPVRVTFTLTRADGAAFTGLVDALRAFVPASTTASLATADAEQAPVETQQPAAPISPANGLAELAEHAGVSWRPGDPEPPPRDPRPLPPRRRRFF